MAHVIASIFALILILSALCLGAFVNPEVAVRALEAQGYSDVKIVDHVWFAIGFRGCDEKDAARFTAKVTNPAGKPAEVYVCTGLFFKAATVRVR